MTLPSFYDYRRLRGGAKAVAIAAANPGITDPTDLPNLTGWWDAEDNSTIVESPAGFAQRWNNKGTTAKDFENLTGGQTPAIVSIAGHQMLFFDGLNDWLADVQSNAVLQPGSGDFTVAALYRAPVGANANGVQIWQQDGAGATPTWNLRGVTSLARFACRDGPTSLTVSSTDEQFADGATRYVIMGQRDNTAGELRLYYGGDGINLVETSDGPTAIPGGFGSVDAVNSALGNFPTVTAGFYWDGHFGEWVFLKSALNASQRFQLFQYFANKWDLTPA